MIEEEQKENLDRKQNEQKAKKSINHPTSSDSSISSINTSKISETKNISFSSSKKNDETKGNKFLSTIDKSKENEPVDAVDEMDPFDKLITSSPRPARRYESTIHKSGPSSSMNENINEIPLKNGKNREHHSRDDPKKLNNNETSSTFKSHISSLIRKLRKLLFRHDVTTSSSSSGDINDTIKTSNVVTDKSESSGENENSLSTELKDTIQPPILTPSLIEMQDSDDNIFSPAFTHIENSSTIKEDESLCSFRQNLAVLEKEINEINEIHADLQEEYKSALILNSLPSSSENFEENEDLLDAVIFIASLPKRGRITQSSELSLIDENLDASETQISNYTNSICIPAKSKEDEDKLTLVLDLDETLVHCSLSLLDPCDFKFKLNLPDRSFGPFDVSVRWRPHLFSFLERIKGKYEVILFTASQKIYANAILDLMDSRGEIFKYRLFRESCRYVNGNFIKDLDVLGRDLSRTIIVDNAAQAFGYHISNGYPISGWYDDPNDQGLLGLIEFLEGDIKNIEDVRPFIRSKFPLYYRVLRYKKIHMKELTDSDEEEAKSLVEAELNSKDQKNSDESNLTENSSQMVEMDNDASSSSKNDDEDEDDVEMQMIDASIPIPTSSMERCTPVMSIRFMDMD